MYTVPTFMMRFTAFPWVVLLIVAAVRAQVHRHAQQYLHKVPVSYKASSTPPSTFDQLIDHNNTDMGTFTQRYWYNLDYWAGPGSPVVLFIPGEVAADEFTGYNYEGTISGDIAKRVGAAAIVLEHRYWGQSSPFDDLTTANLQHLTLENSIRDLEYFAKNARLPWDQNQTRSNADSVPWILVGGSYPGALTAYTKALAPDTFWIGYSSSAPVQVINNFWQYFVPIQQNMPRNCSADVARVIDHLDHIMLHGDDDQVQSTKEQFGLGGVQHNDDFMQALQEGPWLWQETTAAAPSAFQEWCDYIENSVDSNDQLPGPEGVGLQKALDGYARWMNAVYLPGQCGMNSACVDSYNPDAPWFSDTSISNTVNRQWTWILCNEPFGFWQTGAKADRPSIVSRLITAEYWSRQCDYYFPPGPNNETFGMRKGKTEEDVNSWTGGWDIIESGNLSRTIFLSGQRDPWIPGSISSDFRPGGPANGTENVSVHVIPEGTHVCDLTAGCASATPGVEEAQNASIAQIEKWIKEWPGYKGDPTKYT